MAPATSVEILVNYQHNIRLCLGVNLDGATRGVCSRPSVKKKTIQIIRCEDVVAEEWMGTVFVALELGTGSEDVMDYLKEVTDNVPNAFFRRDPHHCSQRNAI